MLLAALAAGSTWSEAATQAGVSPSTVGRRLRDPAFRAELERVRTELIELAADRLAALALRAVDGLAAVLDDPEARAADRVAAARVLLDQTLRLTGEARLRARLEALESAVNRNRRSSHG
jgi:DNA-binding MurR/RpiR family transcriptional regulator